MKSSTFFSLASFCPPLVGFVVACGGAETKDVSSGPPGNEDTSKTVTSLVFKSPCNALNCPAPPSTGSNDTYECAASAADLDACGWVPGSPANGSDPVGTDPNSPVSFSECDAKECPAVLGYACKEGTTGTVVCGRENGGECTNYIVCAPTPGTELCDDNACGPKPELAEICDDGTSAELACKRSAQIKGAGAPQQCAWASGCPTVNVPQGK